MTATRRVLLGVLLAGWGSARAADASARSSKPPEVMTTANRTSGVAPLAVFFDAIDSKEGEGGLGFAWTSGVVQPSDPEGAHYAWDFGDPDAGAWRTTGRPKNTATGYTAAHVFERPGAYTVVLSVTDVSGKVRTYHQTVTVSAFEGVTYYVAAEGSDENDGTDPARPFATFARGIAAVNGGADRRLLLRRGDAFSTVGVTIKAPGPGIIGAYGEGPRPVLNVSGVNGGIVVRSHDWRIMDLDVVGPGLDEDVVGAVSYSSDFQTVNVLVLRVRSSRFRAGFINSDHTPIHATPHDGNAWVECEAATSQVNGMYVGGRRLAVMGNDLHDMVKSHVLRVWQAHKGVISNNRLWNPGPTRHALKLHGPSHGGARPETRWVTISDNIIRGKIWSVAIGPADGRQDERLSHIVFERNRTWGEGSVQADLVIWARHLIVRNNIFDGTNAMKGSYTAVVIGRRGVEPPPEGVRILANTVVRSDESGTFAVVEVSPLAKDTLVRNNLASAPRARTSVLIRASSPRLEVRDDHNLLTTAPRFVDPGRGDYSLHRRSPAVDAGASMEEVREDFAHGRRSRGRRSDIGAHESH